MVHPTKAQFGVPRALVDGCAGGRAVRGSAPEPPQFDACLLPAVRMRIPCVACSWASGEILVPHLEGRARFRWFRHGCAMSGCYTAEDRDAFLRPVRFIFSQLLAAPVRKTAVFGAEPQYCLREKRMNLKQSVMGPFSIRGSDRACSTRQLRIVAW